MLMELNVLLAYRVIDVIIPQPILVIVVQDIIKTQIQLANVQI